MDFKTVEGLNAEVITITKRYQRKLGDGNYGSIGLETEATVHVGTEADADAVDNALYEALRDTTAAQLGPVAEALRKASQGEKQLLPAPEPPKAPQEPPPPESAPEPVRTPVGDDGNELVEMTVTALGNTLTQNGDHVAKVFGRTASDNYEVWGVRAWPEKMDEAGIKGWEHWPICKQSKNGHEKENRFKCPYSKAFVQMENGKAQRVIRFE